MEALSDSAMSGRSTLQSCKHNVTSPHPQVKDSLASHGSFYRERSRCTTHHPHRTRSGTATRAKWANSRLVVSGTAAVPSGSLARASKLVFHSRLSVCPTVAAPEPLPLRAEADSPKLSYHTVKSAVSITRSLLKSPAPAPWHATRPRRFLELVSQSSSWNFREPANTLGNGPAKAGRSGKMEVRTVAREVRFSLRYLFPVWGRKSVPVQHWPLGTANIVKLTKGTPTDGDKKILPPVATRPGCCRLPDHVAAIGAGPSGRFGQALSAYF